MPPTPSSERPVVLVTGSSGLIGQRTIARLRDAYRTVGLDVKPADGGQPDRWIETDLTDDGSVERAIATVRGEYGDALAGVVHLAAYYDFSGEPSPLYDELTVRGTERLVRGLRDLDVGRFVFTSSSLVLQPVELGETLTEDSPLAPAWDYPRSKVRAEEALRQEHGSIPVTVLRVAGAYDEDGHSVPIAQQMRRIHEKTLESLFYPGDASHGQAFVHLDDVARAIRLALEHDAEQDTFEVLLIGEPDTMSYGELQDQIGELMHGREWPTIRIPAPLAKAGAWVKQKLGGGDEFIQPWMIDLADAHRPLSIERARAKLGWEPRHRLRDTLPEMVRRLKQDEKRWYAVNGFAEDDGRPDADGADGDVERGAAAEEPTTARSRR